MVNDSMPSILQINTGKIGTLQWAVSNKNTSRLYKLTLTHYKQDTLSLPIKIRILFYDLASSFSLL